MRAPAGTRSPLLAALLILGALLLAPAGLPQAGESLGVTPVSVEVEDAQRGETYTRQVTVQNQFDSPTELTFEPSGDVGAWTRTDPPSGHLVPPRSDAVVNLSIEVPGDAPNGLHQGHLRVVAEAKGAPDGSGFAFRHAVAVVLNVTVGGEARVRAAWLGAEAGCVETGAPPLVTVRVRNDGNVRMTPRAEAEVRAFDHDEVLAAAGSRWEGDPRGLAPGAVATLGFDFAGASLGPGQYRARVRAVEPAPGGEGAGGAGGAAAEALSKGLEFKVEAPGACGKEGLLRFLEHEPRAAPGLPVKVSAVFENTGRAAIARAKFTAEVHLDGRLVGVLESDPLVVPVGARVNLTAFFTPQQEGVHTLVGTVGYDGFLTTPNESLLTVTSSASAGAPGNGAGSGDGGGAGGAAAGGDGVPGWAPVAVAAMLGGLGAAALVARRGR